MSGCTVGAACSFSFPSLSCSCVPPSALPRLFRAPPLQLVSLCFFSVSCNDWSSLSPCWPGPSSPAIHRLVRAPANSGIACIETRSPLLRPSTVLEYGVHSPTTEDPVPSSPQRSAPHRTSPHGPALPPSLLLDLSRYALHRLCYRCRNSRCHGGSLHGPPARDHGRSDSRRRGLPRVWRVGAAAERPG